MPKKPRSEQEVQKVREEILDKTLELINEVGYENFTMRKLANKLNMTATPIYQYYKNKDELYLAALTQGFETLCNVAEKARDEGKDPMAIPGVLVLSHGPFVWGADPMEAARNAVELEEIAFMAWHTLALNPRTESMQQELLDKHYLRKHGENAYYGQ